jgi:inosose dehydratase
VIVLADEMNKHRMAVSGSVDPSRDGMTDAQWDATAKILTRVSKACRERGLDVVFHHHAGTFIETPEEIERLMQSVDPDLLGLCPRYRPLFLWRWRPGGGGNKVRVTDSSPAP